jgi:hypothetical protein
VSARRGQGMWARTHRARLCVGLDKKTRNSLAHSIRSLMAQLELDSSYNEPARIIMS